MVYIYSMKYVRMFCVFFVVSPAVAQTNFSDGLSVGVGVSATTGINVLLGYHNAEYESYLLRHFGVRIDISGTNALKSAIDSAIDSFMGNGLDVGDGVRIDEGSLDAWHGAMLLDFYPMAGAWRISGGYAWGAADLTSSIYGTVATAPSGRFYFNLAGDHYYYNGNNFSGSADINWDFHGPYIGTGWDIGLFCDFSLFVDLGIIFTSRPARLTLDIPNQQLYIYNTETQVWSPVSIPKLESDVASAQRDANRDLSDFRLFPMVKVGFVYQF